MSEIVTQIRKDMFEATKSGDSLISGMTKLCLAAMQNVEIETGKETTDEVAIEVLTKESKKLKDSISQFDSAGREDLSNDSKKQLQYIETFLPEQVGEDEIRKVVERVVEESGAVGMSDMGRVMGSVMKELKNQADGNVVSRIVKETLSK
jgi:uncharacterized protein YqeY